MRSTRRIVRPAGAVTLLVVAALSIAAPLLTTTRPASAALTAPPSSADPAPAAAAVPVDFAIPNGHYFSQTGGTADGTMGYSATDQAGVRFWSEFQRLGGVPGVGYPVSQRFVWDGFVSQAFQKMVFQWRPEVGQVYAVNVVDLMHDHGLDGWLQVVRATPPISDWSSDTGKPWPEVVAAHQALLTDPDIAATYYAVDDPITLYGLPMAPIQDMGNVLVLRMQRGIIQKWLVDTPWAAAGQVTVANSGDVAKEAGLLPQAALLPEPAPFEHGESAVIPWSGWWWPSHVNGGEPQLWQPGGPLAKYDRYVQSLGQPDPDTAGWSMANMRFYTPGDEWAGHCNGWAAAAILEPEPTQPVTRNGITFSVGDQKGLLSAYHFGDEAAWLAGGADGLTPSEFRNALNLWLSEKRTPLLANLYAGSAQVWSAPAYRYETVYGPDATRPDVHHFRTQVWYADYHVPPNYVGTQIFGGGPKVYEYYLEGPLTNPTGGGWEGISASRSEFARPWHMWYPDPTFRNSRRWTPALSYEIIAQIVPGAGAAPAVFRQAVGRLGLRSAGATGEPLLPNSFWMPDEE